MLVYVKLCVFHSMFTLTVVQKILRMKGLLLILLTLFCVDAEDVVVVSNYIIMEILCNDLCFLIEFLEKVHDNKREF